MYLNTTESEGNINLMSPAFPDMIGSGESSSATVRFECAVTLFFYADVFDLGPSDLSDFQDIDLSLRDHDVTMLMMNLNEPEIFHAADSRKENDQIIIMTNFNEEGRCTACYFEESILVLTLSYLSPQLTSIGKSFLLSVLVGVHLMSKGYIYQLSGI